MQGKNVASQIPAVGQVAAAIQGNQLNSIQFRRNVGSRYITCCQNIKLGRSWISENTRSL